MSIEQYRRRIENITFAEEVCKNYRRKVRINNYIPGQVIYNLGEYPARFSIRPTEYDEKRIAELAQKGVGLIQIHEEWNDALRVLGADKYSSHDPEGLKAFLRLCHRYNIKVLPYISSGYFDLRDPDYTEKFVRTHAGDLFANHFRYIRGNASSPEWNEYLLSHMKQMLDTYEFDGIYNDTGYDRVNDKGELFGETDNLGEYDPYYEDLLARMYQEVKRRGGIVKVHQRGISFVETKERVYDYLWVGECVRDSRDILKTTKFDPFVIFCPDYRFAPPRKAEYYFAMTIPFLQFVLRPDGRPVTGERMFVEGIDYIQFDDESSHYKKVAEYHRSHPNGPHVYSEWSLIPDDEDLREKWFYYLDLYRPMVQENSLCYMDFRESPLFLENLPKNVHATVYVNEVCYLCVSNLGEGTEEILLSSPWKNRESGEIVTRISLPAGAIRFFEKTE